MRKRPVGVTEGREFLGNAPRRSFPDFDVGEVIHFGMQPRSWKDHRLVTLREQVLPHHLTDELEHVVLDDVPHTVVEHLQIRVLDVLRDHRHLFVRQDCRRIQHRRQDRLGNRDHSPGLRQKIARMVAFGYGVVQRRQGIEAVDRRNAHEDSPLMSG